MTDSISPEAIKGVAALARSSTVATAVRWALACVVLPAAGWIGGKLDTKLQVDTLSGKVDVLTGHIAVLTSQQGDLKLAIDALTADPNGAIFQLQVDMRYAHLFAVRATGLALSSARDRKGKLKAADDLAAAFNNKINADHDRPRDAAQTAIATVAVQ